MTKIDTVPQGLFRPESLEARKLAWQGRPALAAGLPATFTTFASMTLAAAIAALITFGTYARRVDMEGTVLPSAGLTTISSPSAGWIAALAVQEGETVENGALLYTLELDRLPRTARPNSRLSIRRPLHGKCSLKRSIAKPR